ncbi:hypothetical protein COY16_06095 [Candidatus Roizmanbacteria bacterium CG_4_10_14_0_2_um_filter_39_13]|uniref:Uncharacterized protein n=1 Tax=Candidatus Roizmanbacteria bacterium CG_4_10_14_0_2_um_filter_39_13 TaxID=1974825 RepID=A0A2M7TV60_9BACT|nr:MAG: hypothetical protein COY16_06095 [Candidatus Roizmanbacteria bacterium CG_4_10_14_0_2_um_filter_39_13]
MSNELSPTSTDAYLALIPTSNEPTYVVECSNSNEGRAFFHPFNGATITDIALMRYDKADVIALLTDDGRAISVVAEKGGFIAVEKKGERGAANLALRPDISHKRLALAVSMAAGEDVTYQDSSFVRGEVVDIDPVATFVRATLDEGFEVDDIHPSWYTEDWMNVRSPDYRNSITIRADTQRILGSFTLGPDGVAIMNIGENNIGSLGLIQPPAEKIPAQLQSPE